MFEFETMQKEATKCSVAIYGPSGSGKTTGALKLAKGIRDELYPNEKLEDITLIIDTEHKSSLKAVGRSIEGEKLEPVKIYNFEPPFDILKLCQVLEQAMSMGIKILILDSYTSFWSGENGILDRVAELEVAGVKKAYGAWSEKEIVTKKNILKRLMITQEFHSIYCMRAKTEYVLETNNYGKLSPKAIGVKEDMQGDVRYEFDIVLSIDKDTHNFEVVKDKIGILDVMENQSPRTLKNSDGNLIAQIVSKGISQEELQDIQKASRIKFILSEKGYNSSKVKQIEASFKAELTEDILAKMSFEQITKIYDYIK